MNRTMMSEEDALEVLRTSPNEYSMTLIKAWFAATPEGSARFDLQSTLLIPAHFRQPPEASDRVEGDWDVRWARGWDKVAETTVGRLVVNNLAFSRSKALRQAFPYYDKPWDKGVIGQVEQRVVDMRLAGVIGAEDAEWVINRLQWLGFAPTSFVVPSMTIDTVRLPAEAKKLKAELVGGELGQRAKAGDLMAMGEIEKRVLDSARRSSEGTDPGMDLYSSGARGSLGK